MITLLHKAELEKIGGLVNVEANGNKAMKKGRRRIHAWWL